MKIVKKTGLLGLGVAAGVIFVIGMILPGKVWAASGLVAEKGSGGTMLAEGCFFDEGTGKLTITEEFGWGNEITVWDGINPLWVSWDRIDGLNPEEVVTVEIDLTGTKIFLENRANFCRFCLEDFINLETAYFTGNIDTKPAVSLECLFRGCSKLKDVDFSGFSNANITDMNAMFEDCSSLRSLDLSYFNTSNVESMGYMFEGCSSLRSLDLSHFDTSSVESMWYMFAYCSSLKSLDLSHFNTSSVVGSMEYMFGGCSLLENLDISNFNTSNVNNMEYMFGDCISLKNLNMRNFDTSNVCSMRGMFYRCRLLKKIYINEFDAQKVQNMEDMFAGCHSLENLDMGIFNTSYVTDMSDMFFECRSLKSLDLSRFDTSNVTDMNGMFRGCSSLESLEVSKFNTSGVADMNSMFEGCGSLKSLDVSGFNTSNVTRMNYMFQDCNSLESLDVSGFNTSNVTTMNYMFWNCGSLRNLDVSRFNTSNVENTSCMFCRCNSLKEIDISNFDFGKVEMGKGKDIFLRMDNIEQIKVPANLPYALQLPYSYTIPNNMESYWVNTSGKECSEIQAGLSVPMTYSRRLRTVTNPSAKYLAKGKTFTDSKTNCKFKVTSSPAEKPTVAFTGVMKKSKKITIPSVVTYQGITCQVTSVSAKALAGNTKIKSLIIGSNITRIEKKAFEGCKNLKKITVETEKLNFVGKNALKRIHKKCRIKVSSSNLKTYRKLFRKKGQKSTVKITK